MVSVDLKDALFTVPIHESNQDHFKFEWEGKVYKLAGKPIRYSDSMQAFIKILKPVYANFGRKGHVYVLCR